MNPHKLIACQESYMGVSFKSYHYFRTQMPTCNDVHHEITNSQQSTYRSDKVGEVDIVASLVVDAIWKLIRYQLQLLQSLEVMVLSSHPDGPQKLGSIHVDCDSFRHGGASNGCVVYLPF